uniref:malate:quinone oxidoreductase n=1 Tax=Staphylococcus pasteuri TaxID=45972 RepID=UPI001649A5B1
ITFVTPKNNLKFLKHPYQKIKPFPIFHNIQYTQDIHLITNSIPLIIKPPQHHPTYIPPTKINQRTHLNYPQLTPKIPQHLQQTHNLHLHYNHQIIHFQPLSNPKSSLKIK